VIDPGPLYEAYQNQARHYTGSLPGKPTMGPLLNSEQAKRWEHDLICTTPTAAEWDAAADARRAAWLAGPFARSFSSITGGTMQCTP
jgi:hypothetical protein